MEDPQNKRENVGDCYFCGQSVWISEGQDYTRHVEELGEQKIDAPTHKFCRKIWKKPKKNAILKVVKKKPLYLVAG